MNNNLIFIITRVKLRDLEKCMFYGSEIIMIRIMFNKMCLTFEVVRKKSIEIHTQLLRI